MTTRRRRSQMRDCRYRFETAQLMGETAVLKVNTDRMEARIAKLERGMTSIDVDVASFRTARQMADVIEMFDDTPFSIDRRPDFDSPEYADDLAMVGPVLRAVVYELWRDYDEWPQWEDVTRRLATWLNISEVRCSQIVCAVPNGTVEHLTCEPPIHDGKRHTANLATWRWYLTDEAECTHQERMYQWRQMLGDNGLTKRTVLTMFAAHAPEHWEKVPA